MSRRRQWIIVIAALIGVAWVGYQFLLRGHRLSFVPEAMGVSNILYAAEESSWGFGPGGNGTSIIVYEMPTAIAARLQAQGLKYLEDLPQQSTGWRGQYSTWLSTPVTSDPRWEWPRSLAGLHGGWSSPGIGDYLFRNGDLLRLDQGIEQLVNDAILRPGSYYAYGRIGVIILIPASRRIVFAYRG